MARRGQISHFDRARIALTMTWVLAMLAGLALVYGYTFFTDGQGIRLLLDEELETLLKPMLAIYALHLSSILAAWYVKPLALVKPPWHAGSWLCRLAVAGTLLFNGMLLYALSVPYWRLSACLGPSPCVEMLVERITFLAKALSFLILPVNWYYFASRPDA